MEASEQKRKLKIVTLCSILVTTLNVVPSRVVCVPASPSSMLVTCSLVPKKTLQTHHWTHCSLQHSQKIQHHYRLHQQHPSNFALYHRLHWVSAAGQSSEQGVRTTAKPETDRYSAYLLFQLCLALGL